MCRDPKPHPTPENQSVRDRLDLHGPRLGCPTTQGRVPTQGPDSVLRRKPARVPGKSPISKIPREPCSEPTGPFIRRRPARLPFFSHKLSSLRLGHRTSLRRPTLFAVGANRVGRRFLSSVHVPVLPPRVRHAERRSCVFVVGAKMRDRRKSQVTPTGSKTHRAREFPAPQKTARDNPGRPNQKSAF